MHAADRASGAHAQRVQAKQIHHYTDPLILHTQQMDTKKPIKGMV